jgi:uncharacterized protein YndB with AHSA1/START domain
MKRVAVEMEFLFRGSPTIVYQFITTPACLIRWFCDEADMQGDKFYFSWDGNIESALVIDDLEEDRVRLLMENHLDNEYLEYRITKANITEDTVLQITDFCDEDEINDTRKSWDTWIKQMRIAMGG